MDLFTARGPDFVDLRVDVVTILVWVSRPVDATVRRSRQPPFGRFEIVMQPLVELLQKLVPDRYECRDGIDNQHCRQDAGVPHRQARANRPMGPGPGHGSPSRSTNPTPRTV
jgi:hypothetical protein